MLGEIRGPGVHQTIILLNCMLASNSSLYVICYRAKLASLARLNSKLVSYGKSKARVRSKVVPLHSALQGWRGSGLHCSPAMGPGRNALKNNRHKLEQRNIIVGWGCNNHAPQLRFRGYRIYGARNNSTAVVTEETVVT